MFGLNRQSIEKTNMTIEQIDKMESGLELDFLVAKEVMKFLIIDITPPCPHDTLPYVPHIAVFSTDPLNFAFHNPLNNQAKNYCWGNFNPSTNIFDAMMVVEKIKKQNEQGFFIRGFDENAKNEYFWEVGWIGVGDHGEYTYYADSEALTIPLAICRAALKTRI